MLLSEALPQSFRGETFSEMSRYAGMTPGKRRAMGIGVLAFFVVMCGMIAFAQWWAYNKNVPAYERAKVHAVR